MVVASVTTVLDSEVNSDKVEESVKTDVKKELDVIGEISVDDINFDDVLDMSFVLVKTVVVSCSKDIVVIDSIGVIDEVVNKFIDVSRSEIVVVKGSVDG